MTAPRKRRSPGDGSVWAYRLKSGEQRYAIGYMVELTDGTSRSVTRRVGPHGEKWSTRKQASDALAEVRVAIRKGEHVDPVKQPLGEYLDEWLDGLREDPSTVASYAKNVRLHITPYLGSVPLNAVTPARIAGLYRTLEKSGRADYRAGEGLSARTVRYCHTILSRALKEAVSAGLLARNPAGDPKQCKPPSAKQAKAPEMHPWAAVELKSFLSWSAEHSDLHAAWYFAAYTGVRRGELLALRWRDVDLDAGTASVRRSVGVVRARGERAVLREGDTKTEMSRRVIDLTPSTVALLRAHKSDRGLVHLNHARPDALVFGDHEGKHLHPERFSRTFQRTVARCQAALKDGAPHDIRLHDLRHTHATVLLSRGEPVKVVSERLGHASVTITLTTYGHVMPGDQKRAADRFEAMMDEAQA